MARRWTLSEEQLYRAELQRLYVDENKTIGEVGKLLRLADKSVYDRLVRLGISTVRSRKIRFNNQRSDVRIPERSEKLAEFIGILLGDGHISHFQIMITLGTKEAPYAWHVRKLLQELLGGTPRIAKLASGHRTVYLGSTLATRWLRQEGLVQNKVASQVDVPPWIFERQEYMKAFVRGFFDSDGSVYSLRYGIQLSFTNRSSPLLHALHKMLAELGYRPSAISGFVFYVTHRALVERFFNKIKPANLKHRRRYKKIMRRWRSS